MHRNSQPRDEQNSRLLQSKRGTPFASAKLGRPQLLAVRLLAPRCRVHGPDVRGQNSPPLDRQHNFGSPASSRQSKTPGSVSPRPEYNRPQTRHGRPPRITRAAIARPPMACSARHSHHHRYNRRHLTANVAKNHPLHLHITRHRVRLCGELPCAPWQHASA